MLNELTQEHLQEYNQYKEENIDKIDIFLMPCYLQHKRIKVPDITPTNFGCTVHTKILINLLKQQKNEK